MAERIIRTRECVAEGADFLCACEARFARAYKDTGPLPLRLKADGFSSLLDAIIGQQISVAAASAIWARMETSGVTVAWGIQQASDDDLRTCGLSGQKIRYARALADADLDFEELRDLPSDVVIARLVEIKGIGAWTAEIYAMFSLGRADVFAPGDLALQEAARVLFALPKRPTEKQLRQMSLDWSPWRSVAARMLWAYYRVIKNREGIK